MEASSFLEDLSSKLYGFSQSQLFCDTLLLIDNQSETKQSFWAHSIVLAAASIDLCTEFQTRSGPGINSVRFCLPLPDCDPMAVEVVLRFLYTGKLIAPRAFHDPLKIVKIFDVCKALGIPFRKLNGVPLTISDLKTRCR